MFFVLCVITYYVISIFYYYVLCKRNIMGNNGVIMSNNEFIITHYYPLWTSGTNESSQTCLGGFICTRRSIMVIMGNNKISDFIMKQNGTLGFTIGINGTYQQRT